MFIAALFTMAKVWKQPECPSVDECIKESLVHLHNRIYAAKIKIEKEDFLLFATGWMELKTIMLGEISQSVKDKYSMISLIRGI